MEKSLLNKNLFSKALLLLFCLIMSLEKASAEKPKVTFLVLYDLSASMSKHYFKMSKLAPIVQSSMENSNCDYQVGVANIFYRDVIENDLKAFGNPAFVTGADGADGIEMIRRRLIAPYMYTKAIGSDEETYTSIFRSLESNLEALKDQHVVGVLLVTDAVPGIDTIPPEIILKDIQNLLGKTIFAPAIVRFPFKNDMKISSLDSFDRPDLSGSSGTFPLDTKDLTGPTDAWPNVNIEALDDFIDLAYGQKWDIYDLTYDQSLQDFVDQVLNYGNCNLIF